MKINITNLVEYRAIGRISKAKRLLNPLELRKAIDISSFYRTIPCICMNFEKTESRLEVSKRLLDTTHIHIYMFKNRQMKVVKKIRRASVRFYEITSRDIRSR